MKKSCILFLITMICAVASFAQGSPIIGPSRLCVGDTVTYADSSGAGFWASGTTSVASIGSSDGTLTGLSAGTTLISYYHPGIGLVTMRVTVEPLPAIGGPTLVFTGSTATLSATPPVGSWNSACPTILTINHTSGVVTGVGSGFCCVTFTSLGGCVSHYCLRDSTLGGPGPITGSGRTCVGGTVTLSDSTGGGSWSSSNTSVATIDSITGIVTGASVGTTTITYTTAGGFVIYSFTVTATPIISGPSTLCVGNFITLAGTPSGGAWFSGSTGIASAGTTSGIITGIATGSTNIYYNAGGCYAYHPVTVNPGPPAIAGPGSVTVSGTITLTDAAPGGVWSSSNSSIALIGSATGVVLGVSTGTCTITYSVGGCYVLKTITVGGTSGIAAITGASGICAGSSTGLHDSTAGGTWSSSNPAIATISSSGIVTGVAAGTCTITYTVGTSYVTRTFVVTSGASISGPGLVCVGASISLAASPTGGAWISGNPSIASVGSSSGLVSGMTAGTVNIYYSLGGCYAYHTVTVTPVPPAIAGPTSTMVGTTSLLTDATPGGTWSSSNPSIASVGSLTGIVTGVSGGICAITYSVGACFVRVYFTVTTTTSAIAPIAGPSTTCIGSSITLMDSTAGGTWSSSNTSIATVTSIGVVTGISSGTCTITYMVGSAYVTHTVTVSGAPYIVGPGTLCAGSTITLTGGPVGGTWTSSTTSVATVSSSGVVSGITAGTATIYYNAGGCYTYHPVTVVTAPAAITGATTTTIGGTATLSDATPGGTWSSSTPSIATVSSTGVVTGVSAGTCAITYTVGGCYVRVYFTVASTTSILPITGPTGTCAGSSVSLHDSTPGGTWSSSNPSVATVSSTGVVTGVSVGTATITYTIGSSYVTHTIAVTSGASITGGGSMICAGSAMTLTGSPAGGTWASSNTAIATAGSTTGIITGITSGICNIYYNAGSGCFAYRVVTVNPAATISGPSLLCGSLSSATLTASVSGGIWSSSNTSVATVSSSGVVIPVAPGTVTIYYLSGICYTPHPMTVNATAAISGGSSLCIGSTITLSATPSGGIWSSSSPSIATVGSTGIVTGIGSGVVSIFYSAGGCIASKTVTVNTAAAISGSSVLCAGTTIPLAGTPAGGTWTSGNTSIATVTSAGVVSATGTGVVNIYYSIGSGCAAFHTVSVNATAAISGATAVCLGSTTTLTASPAGGIWSSSNTSVATVNSSGIVTPVSTGTVTIYYLISTAGGCYASRTLTITSGAAITSTPSTVCSGATTTVTATPSGGTWSSSNPSVATISSTGVLTGVTGGVATITYSSGGCMATRTFTVHAAAALSGPGALCLGSSATLTASPTGGVWFSSSTSVATIGTSSGIVTPVSAGVVSFYYNLGGCYANLTMTVTATAAFTSTPSTVCTGATTLVTATPAGGSWSSSNPSVATISSTGVLTGISTGTAIITYASGGCIVTRTYTVGAGATLSGPGTLCFGSSTTLTASPTGGTWSSSGTSVATIGSSTGIVTPVSTGVVNFYYLLGGCYSAHTVTVTATAAISGGTSVCTGSAITLAGTPSGGTWSSSNPSLATVNSAGMVTGIGIGTVTISYSSGGCTATRMVTVTTTTVSLSGTPTLCIGSTTTLSGGPSGGTWSSSNTSVATVSSTGVVSGVSAGIATITYATPAGCPATRTVTVNTGATITGTGSSICAGTTISLTGTPSGGTWTSSSSTVASVSAAGIVTGVSAGTATIYYNSGGCYAYRRVTVNIPPVAIYGPSTVCTGSAITLTDAVGGGTWSTSNPAIATVSTTGVVIGVAVGTVTIYYSVGTCTVSRTIVVNPTPAPITGPGTISVGSTVALSDATPGGMWISGSSSIASITATGMITGMSAGTVNVYYTVGGCGVYKTITVTTSGSGAPLTAEVSLSNSSTEKAVVASKAGDQGAISENVPTDGTVSIYPNPTNGNLTIEWKDQATGNASMMITDVTGRTVYQSMLNMDSANGLKQISLSDLKSGIYLISIKSDAVHFSSKLVIQH